MFEDFEANAVQDEQAERFVEVLLDYVNTEGGDPEVEDGTVRFAARVGNRVLDVYCWFESSTSRAHITIFCYDAFAPTLVQEVVDFMKPILELPTNVGGQVRFTVSGHVKWTSYCQLSPTDSIGLPLAKELVGVGIMESSRLFDQISAFVAGRTSVGSADGPALAGSFSNGQIRKEEPLN